MQTRVPHRRVKIGHPRGLLAVLVFTAVAFQLGCFGGPSESSSLNPSVFGQPVTFTATVIGATPTGTVNFLDGATTLASLVPLNNGQANFTTSSLALGIHSMTVHYSGDVNNAPG